MSCLLCFGKRQADNVKPPDSPLCAIALQFGVFSSSHTMQRADDPSTHVIIIGAGLAGLSTARRLLAHDCKTNSTESPTSSTAHCRPHRFRVTILESGRCAGGRVCSLRMPTTKPTSVEHIELGAKLRVFAGLQFSFAIPGAAREKRIWMDPYASIANRSLTLFCFFR